MGEVKKKKGEINKILGAWKMRKVKERTGRKGRGETGKGRASQFSTTGFERDRISKERGKQCE